MVAKKTPAKKMPAKKTPPAPKKDVQASKVPAKKAAAPAKRTDKNGRSGMGYTEDSMDKLNRVLSNPQNSQVTSATPSVNNSKRREYGTYLTKPRETERDSSGKTGSRAIEGGPVNPKYIWRDARDDAAKKAASKKSAPKKKK